MLYIYARANVKGVEGGPRHMMILQACIPLAAFIYLTFAKYERVL